jgi:hypothetical protein
MGQACDCFRGNFHRGAWRRNARRALRAVLADGMNEGGCNV